MPTRKIGDLPESVDSQYRPCLHPEHNPPGHLCLPPGIYEHECPACGRKFVFRVEPVYGHVADSRGTGTWR